MRCAPLLLTLVFFCTRLLASTTTVRVRDTTDAFAGLEAVKGRLMERIETDMAQMGGGGVPHHLRSTKRMGFETVYTVVRTY
jgi:hypothetical protein